MPDPLVQLFRGEPGASTPLYQQVVDRVLAGLKEGRLRQGQRLPSINEACAGSSLSRTTVVKAYRELGRMRVLSAVHGKGYYLRSDGRQLPLRAFVLFESLSAYKDRVYQGLVDAVGGRAELDLWFHHFNARLFRRLIADARGEYDRYVVTAFSDPAAAPALAELDPGKLLQIDLVADLPGDRGARIAQDFDRELEGALESGLPRLRRYRSFTLVLPPGRGQPPVIAEAFLRFGTEHGLNPAVVPRLEGRLVRPGEAYLVIEDEDLVKLVKSCFETGLRLGEEVGILSYNDTPLKEVVAGGISVVSIDFHGLGLRAGRFILEPRPVRDVQPTRLILRRSL